MLRPARAAATQYLRHHTPRMRGRSGIATLLLLTSMGLLFGHLPAAAHSYHLGSLLIGHIWAPPTSEDSAAVYGPLLNMGGTPDRLVTATTPMAEAVRFRAQDGAGTMEFEELPLPPGKILTLAPWQAHLWLVGINRPLKAGDVFDLTLTFAEAGPLVVQVVVEDPQRQSPH